MADHLLIGCRALVVEDDYYQAQDCRAFLIDAGASVVVLASRLAGAMRVLSDTSFDLAVLDINLGFDDTLDLARNLRRAGIPILFLTGYAKWIVPDDLADVAYLAKPVSQSELLRELCLLYHNFKSGLTPLNPDEPLVP